MINLNESFENWINGERNIFRKVVKRVIYKCVRSLTQRTAIEIEKQFLEMEEKLHAMEARAIKAEDLNEDLVRKYVKIRIDLAKPKMPSAHKELNVLSENHKERYSSIDYFDFEDHFRGSRDLIMSRQKRYIPYFLGKKSVVDFGCGRGEFLELLSEHKIGYTGVDSYREFVEYCKIRGLDAVCEDAFEYLRNIDVLDGIFVSQVVEHLDVEQIIELANLAYQKLEKGSYIIIETPNPKVLGIFANSFYVDPSHNKPVHPATLRYLLEKAGFDEMEIVFTEESKVPINIPELHVENSDNIVEFNGSMKYVADLLFGSQDYAIIAKK